MHISALAHSQRVGASLRKGVCISCSEHLKERLCRYAYRKLQDWGCAVADYERALAVGSPSDMQQLQQLHVNRAYCLAKLGHYAEALQSYEVVLAKDPTNINALHNRRVARLSDVRP